MRFQTRLRTCAAMLALLAHGIVMTQNTLDTTAVLAEITISATRHPVAIADAPRAVTVLTEANLQASPFVNVAELLSRQAGLYTIGAGQTPGQLSTIFQRGLAGNQTAVFIDGVRLYDPASTDAFIDLAELSLLDVEKIEIVQGNHSTLFGNSAMGGTVHIHTRKKAQKSGISGDFNAQTGVFGKGTSLFNGSGILRYQDKSGVYGSIGSFYQQVNGLDATVDTTTVGFNNRDQDDFNKTDFFGKIGFQKQKFDGWVGFRGTRQDLDTDKGAYRDDDNFVNYFDRNTVQYGAKYDLRESFSLQFTGGFTDLKRGFVDDSSLIAPSITDQTFISGDFEGTTITNELTAVYASKHYRLTVGGAQFQETMTSKSTFYTNDPFFGSFLLESDLDSLDLSTNTYSAFAQAAFGGGLIGKSLENVNLILAGRYVHHSRFGNVVTFNINPSVKIGSKTTLYGGFSTGYNAPSLYQLYSPDQDFTSGITRGNPELKPETIQSLELGVRQTYERFRWNAALFSNTVQNAIQYVFLWAPTNNPDTLSFLDYRGDSYINIGSQNTRGLEVSAVFYPVNGLQIGGNYTWLKGSLEVNKADINDRHILSNLPQLYNSGLFLSRDITIDGLVRRPQTGNLFVQYQSADRWSVRADMRYAGARDDVFYDFTLGAFGGLGRKEVDAYTVLDMSGKYTLFKGLDIQIRLENLLNTEYSEILGYTTRGRGIYGGLKYRF